MRTSNPTLNQKILDNLTRGAMPGCTSGGDLNSQYSAMMGGTETMTVQGTVNKTLVMLLLLLATASLSWREFFSAQDAAAVMPHLLVGGIGGFIVAMVTVFKKQWSPVTAPIYAILEGLMIGGLSAMFEMRYPGIVIQAVMLTFGTCFALLMAFKAGMIQATARFRAGIFAATGGIGLFYLASFVGGFFGFSIPLIHSTGTFGILFSLFVVAVAALNLILDFDFVKRGAEAGAPKYVEWYAAFGLMVTLIWLYIEILRLLAKLRRR
jgi:uncharacterized YccA/Bax inhibitor family protein